MDPSDLDAWHMTRALELAMQGQGNVEPNPLVGCVIARGAEIIGEGWHRRFGGPHAEIEALTTAGGRAAGSTMYVSLEPCCHFGKTPPCTKAIIQAGIRRVVVAQRDPFPKVAGGGIDELRAAGIEVEVGVQEAAAQRLNAPYLKLISRGRPWVIAKWAMTLDGKIATRTRDSRWISGAASRQVAHTLRGRVDAILVGRGTVDADDPLLTARPPGPRVPLRVVMDSRAAISLESQLVRTAGQTPLLVAVGPEAAVAAVEKLRNAGCEIFACAGSTHAARLVELLDELGRRRITNLLVEGGSQILGSLLDAQEIDEVHVFVAPKIIGGADAPGPIAAFGAEHISQALQLDQPIWRQIDGDLYLQGRVLRT